MLCFSLTKSTHKKSVVGAWISISVGRGEQRTAKAPQHPKFHAPTYRGHAWDAATSTPRVAQRDILIFECSPLWGAGLTARCSHEQGGS